MAGARPQRLVLCRAAAYLLKRCNVGRLSAVGARTDDAEAVHDDPLMVDCTCHDSDHVSRHREKNVPPDPPADEGEGRRKGLQPRAVRQRRARAETRDGVAAACHLTKPAWAGMGMTATTRTSTRRCTRCGRRVPNRVQGRRRRLRLAPEHGARLPGPAPARVPAGQPVAAARRPLVAAHVKRLLRTRRSGGTAGTRSNGSRRR